MYGYRLIAENWFWSLLGLKGLIENAMILKSNSLNKFFKEMDGDQCGEF